MAAVENKEEKEVGDQVNAKGVVVEEGKDDGHVRGMGEAMRQAEAGLKLFKEEVIHNVDLAAAAAYKDQQDAKIKELEDEAGQLHGKDNMKARAAKGKEAAALKAEETYVDACKIGKGLQPKFLHFVVGAQKEAVAEAKEEAKASEEVQKDDKKKDDKKPKKTESAGISPAETKELETLKNDIIARKTQLKAEGMSGGQQNKDSEVMGWVKRMNELKEKQDPGCTQKDKKDDKKKSGKGGLTSIDQKECDDLKNEMEIYKSRLRTEFGYTNKDIKADPELAEMDAKLKVFEKRGAMM